MKKVNKFLESLNPEFLQFSDYIKTQVDHYRESLKNEDNHFISEKDNLMITYADQFTADNKTPLQTLNDFLLNDLEGSINSVHLLPFFPWTSDDGFSPKTYKEVEPAYGSWEDIEALKAVSMFDCVFNHLSSENEFFQKALEGSVEHQKMFHIYDDKDYETHEFQLDVQKVVRPRVSPLFSEYSFPDGHKYVWTTFSQDQVDTNLNNPVMFKYILESFFLYIKHGARLFRIDAVPFLWKELGTSCSHHPKTHIIIKLFRAIIEEIGSRLLIVTESNVPHHENISYWGDEDKEAHLIYNFTLAPLLLHAIIFETNQYLFKWSKDVYPTPEGCSFLNFTASHDGIGMRGLEGVVPDGDVQTLCELAKDRGGLVSDKRSRDGTVRPYELNITWASMLNKSEISQQDYIRKVVNSHAVIMFFPGLPAHYAHNFLGTPNWVEGYKYSGIARRLNRKKLSYPIEYSEYSEAIKTGLLKWVNYKSEYSCFAADTYFEALNLNPSVLSFLRGKGANQQLIVFNLTKDSQAIEYKQCSHSLKPYEMMAIKLAESNL